jgi:hypothetical protein
VTGRVLAALRRYELNGWQRLWVVVSVLLLPLVAFVAAQRWPRPSAEVFADLIVPECEHLRKLPKGFVPTSLPAPGAPCASLQQFLFTTAANVRSDDDYLRYVSVEQVKVAAASLGIWLAIAALIYFVGWSYSWVLKGFRRGKSP